MIDSNTRLLGTPREYNRIGDLGQVQNMPLKAMRTYYHHLISCKLPLTEAEFENTLFGQSIGLFTEDPPPACGPECSVQTNMLRATLVTSPFMICGIGIVAIGESKSFAAQGLVTTHADGAVPAVVGDPNVCNELYAGMPDFDGNGGALAQMWWGGPTWNLIEAFLQAYRLQFVLGGRWLVIDELLQDIGLTRQNPKFVGAGESRLATMPFIRDVNDVLHAKDFRIEGSEADLNFMTINTEVDADGASACVPPPLASFMQGGQDIAGLAQRVFTFRDPILVVPGMPIEASFVLVKGSSYFSALKNKVTFNLTAPAAGYTTAPVDGVVNCGVVATVPGGQFQFGLVLLGFEMWPAACLDYLYALTSPFQGTTGSLGQVHPILSAYSDNPWVMTMANKYRDKFQNLAGVLAGIPKQN